MQVKVHRVTEWNRNGYSITRLNVSTGQPTTALSSKMMRGTIPKILDDIEPDVRIGNIVELPGGKMFRRSDWGWKELPEGVDPSTLRGHEAVCAGRARNQYWL